MKKTTFALGLMMGLVAVLRADTELVDGLKWRYAIVNGQARIGDYEQAAIPESTAGAVVIPGRLGGCAVTHVESDAFRGCRSLTSVTIPASVREIGEEAFATCSSLTSIVVDAANPLYVSQDGVLFSKDRRTLVKVPCGISGAYEIPSGVSEVEYDAFGGCAALESLTISASVDEIDGGALRGCVSLKSIAVDPSNRWYYSQNGVLFGTEEGRTLVKVPACGVSGAYEIPLGVREIDDYAFADCTAVETVTIPASVTEIGDAAFYGCTALKSIAVAASNPRYSSQNGVLFSKDKRTLVRVPCGTSGAYEIPSSVREIDDDAFGGCSLLTAVSIPPSVVSIGEGAFAGCEALTTVRLPSGLREIEDWIFAGCTGLASVNIPNGVVEIGESAFEDCGALASVRLPTGLKEIEPFAFRRTGLTAIDIPDSVTQIGEGAFAGCSLTSVALPPSATDAESLYYSGLDFVSFADKGGVLHIYSGDEDRVRRLLETVFAEGYGYASADAVELASRIQFEVRQQVLITGARVDLDVGLVGYTAKGLPKGLSYNARTGRVTGTAKEAGEFEAVFSKRGEEDVVVAFRVRAEEAPSVAAKGLGEAPLTVGVAGDPAGIPLDISAESGVKSVTAAKLPTGMRLTQDKATGAWSVTGAPTKPGVYEVTLTVTTVAGAKTAETVTVTVEPLPTAATGAFNGFVVREDGAGATLNAGTLAVSATDAGRITAKVVTAAGSCSFSATGWTAVDGDVYAVTMATRKNDVLTLSLDASKGWNEKQLTGAFTPNGGAEQVVEAQRNAFGRTWHFAAEGDAANGWTFAYATDAKAAALTVTLNADGKTAIAGTLPGGPRVSASGYADVGALAEGGIIADFAPIVSVKDGKATVKRILSISTNLMFDRSNDHGFVGSAKIVE
ncbi:MAG: leucine-rich repeat protein [Kiritimatiellia bacterium]